MSLPTKKTLIEWGALLVLPILLFSCAKEEPLSDIAKKGKAVYMANCIACHNPDPRLAGSVGPQIAWTDEEVIRERVLRKSYPKGYKPKRNSTLMPTFPHLENEIISLAAYLNSFTKSGL